MFRRRRRSQPAQADPVEADGDEGLLERARRRREQRRRTSVPFTVHAEQAVAYAPSVEEPAVESAEEDEEENEVELETEWERMQVRKTQRIGHNVVLRELEKTVCVDPSVESVLSAIEEAIAATEVEVTGGEEQVDANELQDLEHELQRLEPVLAAAKEKHAFTLLVQREVDRLLQFVSQQLGVMEQSMHRMNKLLRLRYDARQESMERQIKAYINQCTNPACATDNAPSSIVVDKAPTQVDLVHARKLKAHTNAIRLGFAASDDSSVSLVESLQLLHKAASKYPQEYASAYSVQVMLEVVSAFVYHDCLLWDPLDEEQRPQYDAMQWYRHIAEGDQQLATALVPTLSLEIVQQRILGLIQYVWDPAETEGTRRIKAAVDEHLDQVENEATRCLDAISDAVLQRWFKERDLYVDIPVAVRETASLNQKMLLYTLLGYKWTQLGQCWLGLQQWRETRLWSAQMRQAERQLYRWHLVPLYTILSDTDFFSHPDNAYSSLLIAYHKASSTA